MNDNLINKLYSKARENALIRASSGKDACRENSDYFNDMRREEFIELVVRECANVTWNSGMDVNFENRMRKDIYNSILQHFGLDIFN